MGRLFPLSCVRSAPYYSRAFRRDKWTVAGLDWKGTTPTVATLLPMNYGYTTLEIRHGKLVLTWLLPVTTSSGGGPGPIAGCGADCRCSLRQRRRSPGGYPRLRKPRRACYTFAVPFGILRDSGRYSTRATAERCQSGRMGATGNRVGVNASRGFESRPLRHIHIVKPQRHRPFPTQSK